MKAKQLVYFPQTNYWPRWPFKRMPNVIVSYDESYLGSCFISGVELPNQEMILFEGSLTKLFEECRDLVKTLEQKKSLPDYAHVVEEFENGEAEREAEEKRVNDYHEREILDL